ncbi:MAG TPA: hypothetical protein VIQ30_22660 [Pseudonocardia sp.]
MEVRIDLNIGQVKAVVRAAEVRGLFLAAEHGLGESDRRVPIEEGTLSRSGATSVDAANLRAAVSYDTEYAVVQHERLDFQHDAGREAKFLENALNSNRDVFLAIIAAQVRRVL